MTTKALHFLALLSFLNMLTFDKSKHMELMFGTAEVVTDTVMEFILEDIMDFDSDPVCDPGDPDIVYEDFLDISASFHIILPVFLFFAGFIFTQISNFSFRDHPNYFSKVTCELGYYTFLSRFRPF